jgi:hypothetical protein
LDAHKAALSDMTIRVAATAPRGSRRHSLGISPVLPEVAMRIPVAMLVAVAAASVHATLPPLSEDAQAQAALATAKTAWSDKLDAYKLCVAKDQTAEYYRHELRAEGKPVPAPVAMPPCTDPGPFVAPTTPVTAKPLEAAGAHSPAGDATSPPSTSIPSHDLQGPAKK